MGKEEQTSIVQGTKEVKEMETAKKNKKTNLNKNQSFSKEELAFIIAIIFSISKKVEILVMKITKAIQTSIKSDS